MHMKHMKPLAALAALLIATACTDGKPAPGSPSPTPTTSSTPTATATPKPVTRITATNAASMKPGASLAAAVNVQHLTWGNDGTLWVVGTRTVDAIASSGGSTKRVLDVTTPERILAVSPAGVAAVGGGESAPLRLVDVASGKTLRTLASGGFTSATFFKGNRVVLVAGDRIAATIWDTDSGQQVGELKGFQTAAPVYNVIISNDGARAAWVSRGTLQFSDVATNAMGARVSFQDFIGAYTFLSDGKTFATTVGTDPGSALPGLVQLWDASTGKETLRIPLGWLPLTIDASNEAPGAPVLLATGGEGLGLWSAADGKQVVAFDRPTAGRVTLVAFAPDGSALATVAEESGVRIWRPAP